jgi:hypothetical protein
MLREPFDFDLDTVFEYGLQRLLDGIDTQRSARNLEADLRSLGEVPDGSGT